MSTPSKLPAGFEQSFSHREKPCIGIFAPAYGGKTRLCATASEWADARGTKPGWAICDRKTRQTIEYVCNEMGMTIPVMSKSVYITPQNALKLASSDDEETTKKVYREAFDKLSDDLITLASLDYIDPIIVDSGTELWEWIGYSRLGRREGVKGRYWGPSGRDWKDLFGALSHKTTLITLWERNTFKDDKVVPGQTAADGPPALSYTTTSLVRLRKTDRAKTNDEKYHLDLTESIDNKGLEGTDDLLTGEGITFSTLMSLLRPED